MKKWIFFLYVLPFLMIASPSITHADKGHVHPIKITNKDFEKLTQLVGTWKGTHKNENGTDEEMVVKYRLTSAGSVLMEEQFPGTDHEMVTLYFNEGKKVAMTHYCAFGNHPKMVLKNSKNNEFFFDFAGTGLHQKNEPHMHSLKMNLTDTDHLQQEWTFFENGKLKQSTVLQLARQK